MTNQLLVLFTKIVSIEDENGVMQDTIKLSNNAEKVSTPGKNKFGASQVAKEIKQKVITSLSLIQTLTNLMKFTCSTQHTLTSIKQ